jgi:rare lipoprotein A
LPTCVIVTNLRNNKSILLRVNDRGPFVKGRIIDVSYRAAQILDFVNSGLTEVRVEVVKGSAP